VVRCCLDLQFCKRSEYEKLKRGTTTRDKRPRATSKKSVEYILVKTNNLSIKASAKHLVNFMKLLIFREDSEYGHISKIKCAS